MAENREKIKLIRRYVLQPIFRDQCDYCARLSRSPCFSARQLWMNTSIVFLLGLAVVIREIASVVRAKKHVAEDSTNPPSLQAELCE